MHSSRFLPCIAFALLCLLPADASAARISIKQKCDYACLQAACKGVGGRFSGSVENGYVCVNDAKGTSVGCLDSVCHGNVPKRVKGGKGTIGGVLQAPVLAR
jgi:hypothetical protein